MKHRKLRIAWSVAWGVVAVLLCVLWVAGHYYYCVADVKLTPRADVDVVVETPRSGTFQISIRTSDTGFAGSWAGFAAYGFSPGEDNTANLLNWKGFRLGWNSPESNQLKEGYYTLGSPCWFPLALAVPLASIPWLPHRFSLRTLFIATTLVAVVLGIIVYALRS